MKQKSTSAAPRRVVREEAAGRYLDHSVAWLRKHRTNGTGPAYIRAGRSIRYCVSDLDAWLDAHRVKVRAADVA